VTPQQTAVARARGYHLLAGMLLRGPARVPAEQLAAVFPGAPDHDDLAAEFVAAFDLGVPPYASVFLEADGRAGQTVSRHAVDVIAADGLAPITEDVAACHVGVLLGHAGRLCAAGEVRRAGAFVDAEILSWLPPFVVALETLPVPRWRALIDVALDLVAEHALLAPARPRPDPGPTPHPLIDPRSGLRDVAAFLGAPSRCGFYLTDAECSQIGRTLDVPRGFGPRRMRIETMLRTAAEYGRLEALCTALDGVAASRATRLLALARRRFDPERLGAWLTRLETTRDMLTVLHDGAAGLEATKES
jgi:TorA maturation chaperone TorD